jgi:hypothetical protein
MGATKGPEKFFGRRKTASMLLGAGIASIHAATALIT